MATADSRGLLYASPAQLAKRREAMKSKTIYIGVAAPVVLVPVALLLRTFSASPLPMPEPYMGPLPSGTPPKGWACSRW